MLLCNFITIGNGRPRHISTKTGNTPYVLHLEIHHWPCRSGHFNRGNISPHIAHHGYDVWLDFRIRAATLNINQNLGTLAGPGSGWVIALVPLVTKPKLPLDPLKVLSFVKFITTFSNWCFGSHNDEERNEMRYVMRIEGPWESSNVDCTLWFWVMPKSMLIWVSPNLTQPLLHLMVRLCSWIWLCMALLCSVEIH